MPVATSNELLTTLGRSELVPATRLRAWLDRHPGAADDTPRELAVRLVSAGLVTPFQAKGLLQGRHKGYFIARKYKVLDQLGSGGMGAVYLCEHLTLGSLVAVKVLPPVPSENPEARERFYREARAFASLNHPNLVRGFDVDADGKIHFIVMEYVDGVDLQALVARRGPLPAARAANYVRQAAVGLAHAHARGWVHRDIKPANIAVDRAGVARVLDMGLARMALAGGDWITRHYGETTLLGTPDYLAPEQAAGGAVDGRTDVYSLGATLYFLLTARAPFPGGSVAQKLIAHQLKPPPSVRAVRPDLPAGLAAVAETMMAKRPDDRYQSGLELADALARWDAGGPFPPADDEAPSRHPGSTLSTVGIGSTVTLPPVREPTPQPTVRVVVAPRPADGTGTGRTNWPVWVAGGLAAALLGAAAVEVLRSVVGPPRAAVGVPAPAEPPAGAPVPVAPGPR